MILPTLKLFAYTDRQNNIGIVIEHIKFGLSGFYSYSKNKWTVYLNEYVI